MIKWHMSVIRSNAAQLYVSQEHDRPSLSATLEGTSRDGAGPIALEYHPPRATFLSLPGNSNTATYGMTCGKDVEERTVFLTPQCRCSETAQPTIQQRG